MGKQRLSKTSKYVALGCAGASLALVGFCLGGLFLIGLLFGGPPPAAMLCLIVLIPLCGIGTWLGVRWTMRAWHGLNAAPHTAITVVSTNSNIQHYEYEQPRTGIASVPLPLVTPAPLPDISSILEQAATIASAPLPPNTTIPLAQPPQPPAPITMPEPTFASMVSTTRPGASALALSSPTKPVSASTPEPLPPSTTPSIDGRFVEIVPSNEPSEIGSRITFSISYETRNSAFLADMRRRHRHTARPTIHVPFMQYWPTYSSMSTQQQQWYFYWRSLVRQEQYLPTDLSYIFVHIYEILNLVEEPNPQQASTYLWRLWQQYRVQHPKLDRYLADWGGDLLAIHVGSSAAVAWWQLCLAHGVRLPASTVNVMVQHYVDTHTTQDIPYSLWAALMSYQPRNKFYAQHNVDGQLDRSYDRAIRLADRHVIQTEGRSLLEQYRTTQLTVVDKPVFISALIDDRFPKTVNLGIARSYVDSKQLNQHLNSVVKQAENLLRKQAGVARKLSGISLDPALISVLETAFLPVETLPQPSTKRGDRPAEAATAVQGIPLRLNLDPKRIAVLHDESAEIRLLLTPQEDERSTPSMKPLYTDLAAMRQLWTTIEPHQQRIITDIYWAQQLVEGESKSIAYQVDMKEAMDRINQLASTLLGDELIYMESDSTLTLAEDFVDEISIVLQERPSVTDITSVDALAVQSPVTAASITSPPTANGAQDGTISQPQLALTAVERTLLQQFLAEHMLSDTNIDQIARSYQSMGNMVLESLNEKMTEVLGFAPVYFDGTLWTLDIEYEDTLRQQLAQEGS